MYTTGQGKVRQGVVELAYEVTHPLEEERDTLASSLWADGEKVVRPGNSRWPFLLHAFPR